MPPETPATPLIVQVQRHARAAIDTELHRLARRIQYIVMTLQLAAASGFVAVARFGPVAF